LSEKLDNEDVLCDMRGVVLAMIPMKLNNIIMWCGGAPIPPLEDVILPLAQRDLDPLIKSSVLTISNDHKQRQVRDALVDSLFSRLPDGWKCEGRYQKTPHLHLTFNGPEAPN